VTRPTVRWDDIFPPLRISRRDLYECAGAGNPQWLVRYLRRLEQPDGCPAAVRRGERFWPCMLPPLPNGWCCRHGPNHVLRRSPEQIAESKARRLARQEAELARREAERAELRRVIDLPFAKQVEWLVELAMEWRLSRRGACVYIAVPLGDDIPATWPLCSPEFRRCLAGEYHALCNRRPARDALRQALNILEARGRQLPGIRLIAGERQ